MPNLRRRGYFPADSPDEPRKLRRPIPWPWVAPRNPLVALFCNLASQDVARANAGLAAIRIHNRLRQQVEVEAYLRQLAEERSRALEDDIADRAV